ncbi:phage tail sheath protein [Paenibacillaceae bacterium]|nr:phage tail sheath protein [Paenibacillaceae bacterium]
MAGGTFTMQNKVRPGVYINFKSRPQELGTLGERGVAAYPAALPWGEPGKVIELNAETYAEKSLELIGFKSSDARIRHISAAMSHASKVLLYRLGAANAAKAAVTEGELTATAKWGGVRGNDLKIVVQPNIDQTDSFDVLTLIDNEEVDRQTAAVVEELKPSAYIDWTGTGELTATAGAPLAGGTEGASAGADLSNAFTAFESQSFNVLGFPISDEASKKLAVAYVKRQREEEGKKIVLVLANYPEADYEGVISLRNGIVTADGLQVEPASLLWEIAAMEAAANINESLTYTVIPNAVDAYPRLSNHETISALRNGELVITAANGAAVIEQDLNTLTSFTADRAKPFSKNRVVRVLDSIANDIKRIFDQFYIGKVGNTQDGRALLKSEVAAYLNGLQGLGAVENFDSQTDLAVLKGQDAESVIIELSVQPVDSVEKIYMTVEVV